MFCLDDNTSVELLGVFKLKRGSYRHSSTPKRYYDGMSIRLCGSATFRQGNRTLQVQPGDLLYCPQHAQYIQQTDGETLIVLHFIRYSAHTYTDMQKITLENRAEIERLMVTMYDLWSQKKPGYKCACMASLYHLLYLVQQERHESTLQSASPPERLSAAIDYLHKHYKQDKVSVAELAKLSAVSETYFRQLFKKIYGVSPCRYVTKLRLELAFQLLQSRLYTVAEVSEKAGFRDVKYFERVFKKQYGFTPAYCKRQIPESATLR